MFKRVVLTQDWHPRGHVSFASSWPGRALYDSVEAEGIPQVLWPDHCVQGSRGADFHPGLDTEAASLILRKGMRPRLDSYSAFFENDRTDARPASTAGCGPSASPSSTSPASPPISASSITVLDALRLGYKVQRRRGRRPRRRRPAGGRRPRLQRDAPRGRLLRRVEAARDAALCHAAAVTIAATRKAR